MSMVEFGNNLVTEEGLDVLHNLLDFPMECLEEDEDAGNWDMSNMESLGPIPSNVLMPYEMFGFQRPNLFPKPVASLYWRRGVSSLLLNKSGWSRCCKTRKISDLINGVPELKQLPKHVDASSLHILPLRKFAEVQESPSCCTQIPVSVLESSGSHPREKSLSIKSCYVIPVKSRSKRVRHTGINPWLLAAHGLSTSKQAPNARKSRETRKKRCQQPFATGMLKNSPRNVDNTLDVSDPVHLQNHFKKCSHCQSTKTPQWRWGPSGRNSLCNACGVRYRSGRLFPEYRPAASPSFTQSQHSNSHKKVTELRNKANLSTAKTKIEIVRAPEGKHLTKHDDTSCSIFPLWNAEAPKQKKLAKYDITCCLHIPSQIEHANVDESCYHISILESSGSSSRERRLSFMSSRSKCVKPAGANPLLSALSCTSKRTSNASERDQSSKKLFERSVVVDVPKKCPKNDDDSLYVSDPVNLQNGPIFGKKCAHCESTKTPQWREGPSGPRTLCNACGVRYRSGRLVSEYRPAASPTFVPSKHSNLHSKVLQMINAVEHSSLRPEVKTKTSPQPE